MVRIQLVTTYLEMQTPGQLCPAKATELRAARVGVPCPEFQRFLYTAVGGQWYWLDRLRWSYERWLNYLQQPQIHTWVGYLVETPAGYFELSQQQDGSVKLEYFGLLPQFIGQGHGGYLLTVALEQAWALGANRVWLHTNSIDGPHALYNYKARGLVVYKQETMQVDLPQRPPGPWPGSGWSRPSGD